MPAVKVIHKDTRGERRRPLLWECFGFVGVNPTDIKETRGVYYVIVGQEELEGILKADSKQTFIEQGFEVLPPIEYNALRTIVIRHIDKVIDEYTDEEIINNIC